MPPILLIEADARRDQLIATTQALIAAPSPNPPLDTGAVAAVAGDLVRTHVKNAQVALHPSAQGVVNLTAVVRGHKPGRRLILNGHLDTYPVNESLPWTVDPLGGHVQDNRIYGRGAADMKGGIAASIMALSLLADHPGLWSGEAVLTLGGDEESMGVLGTQWLIDNVPHARGDAAIIGDAGSPSVVRFGEKGFLWVELATQGKPAHGAHVHLGTNAIDRLREALDSLASLRDLPVPAPDSVLKAMQHARPVSEQLSGAGEHETLARVTVNIGHIAGGTSMNLIPASARAGVDIRLPVGLDAVRVEQELIHRLSPLPGVSWQMQRRSEPNFTPPDAEIVTTVLRAAERVSGHAPVANMRVGASDSRLYRAAGVPTVVFGPTPFNMGGADEYALIDELLTVTKVHALAALTFLA